MMIDSSRKYVGELTTSAGKQTAGVAVSSPLSSFLSSGQFRRICPRLRLAAPAAGPCVRTSSSCASATSTPPLKKSFASPLRAGGREGCKLLLK
jgi:hypothetical protein